jgi:hypothetical protein
MIDTVTLGHSFRGRPPSEAVKLFDCVDGGPGGFVNRRVFKMAAEGRLPRPRLLICTGRDGFWHLQVTVSLPKMLFGNNVRMVTDDEVREALAMITGLVSSFMNMDFDAFTAVVRRVDYCYNFRVGAVNVRRYLKAIAGANFPRRTRRTHEASVYFESGAKSKRGRKWKSCSTKFYDKNAEVRGHTLSGTVQEEDLLAAAGVLRVESSFLSRAGRRLASISGSGDRTAAGLLTGRVAVLALNHDLKSLGLAEPILPTDSRLDKIRAACGEKATPPLAGFLTLLDCYGEHFWKQGIDTVLAVKQFSSPG